MAKKISFTLLCAIICAVSLLAFYPKAEGASEATEAPTERAGSLDPYDDGLHSIYELNCEADELDSHSGFTSVSTLELDFRNSYFIKNEELIDSGTLWYPRLKRLSDGSYILFFQDGKHGPNVYYTRSNDGYSWDEPTVLFAKHSTYNDRYWRYYATCDAIELENGNIVVAAIFHVNRKTNNDVPSRWLMSEKGIVTKLSRDGGNTWTEQQEIYNGRCWEPSFLQLPDGTVQMYFTQSAPKDAAYNTVMGSHVSSGVGLISSRDNGETWSPIVKEAPYVTSRIVQQYIYTNENGIPIMTDQMPVAILLHDQKTIVMAVESLTSFGGKHNTSIIRSHDFFATSLGENETGPYDRENMLFPGPAPYIVQFPSGEIAVSNSKKVYLGNELGTEFYTDRSFNLYPHQSSGVWGDMFVGDSHVLLASASDTVNGIGVSRLILNHRIEAKTASVKVDGYTADWYDNTDALFVGSINQAQTSIRAAHDKDNLYFLFESLDYYVTSKDTFTFSLREDGSDARINIYADTSGVTRVELVDGGTATALDGFNSAVKIYGTKDVNTDKDEGVAIEFSIPRSCIKNAEDLRVFMKMYGNDGEETFSWDGFNGLTEKDQTTWHILHLSSDVASTEPPSIPDVDVTDNTTQPSSDTTQSADGASQSEKTRFPHYVPIIAVIVCTAASAAVCLIIRSKKRNCS